MQNLFYFQRAWLAEQVRLRHSWVYKLMLLAPVFVCGMYFCIFYFEGEHFVKDGQAWNALISTASRTVFVLFLPLFIILFTLLNQQLDHQANTRKLLYTLPVPRNIQVLAQWINTLWLYTLTVAGYVLLLLLTGWLLSVIRTELGFEQFVDAPYFTGLWYGFLGSLAMLALQFVLSYFFKNMIIPLSIGMVGFISALVLLNWEYVIYHPFVYQLFGFMQGSKLQALEFAWWNQPFVLGPVLALICLAAGYIMRKRVDLL